MENIEILSPFMYLPPSFQQQNQQSFIQQNGDQVISNVSSLSVGAGMGAFYMDKQGFWLGNTSFANAPFSVDMNGNLVAKTGNILTYRRSFISTVTWSVIRPNLSEGLNFVTTTSDLYVVINGTQYHISVGAGVSVNIPSGTVPARMWAIYGFYVNTSGSFQCLAGANNYTTGYSSQENAEAAIPTTPANNELVFYLIIQASTGNAFVAGTDNLSLNTHLANNQSIECFTLIANSGTIYYSGGNQYAISQGWSHAYVRTSGVTGFQPVIYAYFDTANSGLGIQFTTDPTVCIGLTKSLLNILYTTQQYSNGTTGLLYNDNGIEG